MSDYDRFFGHFRPAYDFQALTLAGVLGAEVGGLYDICCGPGLFLEAFARYRPDIDLTAVDLDPTYLDEAGLRAPGALRVLSDAAAFLRGTPIPPGSVILLRGCYHFIAAGLPLPDLLGLLGDGVRLVIGERSPASADSFPLPPDARSRLAALVSGPRQAAFLHAGVRDWSVRRVSCGEVVLAPVADYVAALRSRSMSYLRGSTEAEIDAIAADLAARDATVPILEEYAYYIYSRSNPAET